MHPHAQDAAEAAEAAGAHKKFWEMHDTLYTHQEALENADLVNYAVAIGLDARQVARELAEDAYLDRVREDFISGARSGVNGTPSFFIEGFRYDGPYDFASLLAVLETAAEKKTA
jgi:protein-disulfide isomerase